MSLDGLEIERRFRIKNNGWRAEGIERVRHLHQKTVARDPNGTITRLRLSRAPGCILMDCEAFITIKQKGDGHRIRPEVEWSVPYEETLTAFKSFLGSGLAKLRYRLKGPAGWDVNLFRGSSAGLELAEIEFATPEKSDELGTSAFPFPSWLGEEVTDDPRYLSSNLEREPWLLWGQPCRHCLHLAGDHVEGKVCTRCSCCCLDVVGAFGDPEPNPDE